MQILMFVIQHSSQLKGVLLNRLSKKLLSYKDTVIGCIFVNNQLVSFIAEDVIQRGRALGLSTRQEELMKIAYFN